MLGERLKAMRESQGYTQEELAEKAGIPVLQIYRYEHNKTKPDGEIIARIAMSLGISADYLLGITDEPGVRIEGGLSPKERRAIVAWREGDYREAIKVIVDDE